MRKPVIGVMPLWDEEKNSIWMLPGYLEGIRQAGGVPFIFPMMQDREELMQLCGLCDGFLFTGGQDVNPERYAQKAQCEKIVVCDARDSMESIVLAYALEKEKAVLGICRGLQFINVAFGGTLYQDLPTQHPSAVEHHMTAPYDRIVHMVQIEKDTPLYTLLKKERLGVNSYHHQAVKTLAPQLCSMAKSEDGLVEAVYAPQQKFVWAVQWHPEFSYKTQESSRQILQSFVKAAGW